MEKSLYAAPQGIDMTPAAQDGTPFEFDIEGEGDPDTSLTVVDIASTEFSRNLAEEMTDSDLSLLGSELVALVDDDIESRKEWAQDYVKGLEVLGLHYEERTEPWIGACGVYSSVLAEAAIRFQSETIMETFPAAGPVKTEIIGEETPEKTEAALRVKDDKIGRAPRRCRSSVQSTSGCCSAWGCPALRSRRCTSIRRWIGKRLCLLRLRMSSFLTARAARRLQNVLRT